MNKTVTTLALAAAFLAPLLAYHEAGAGEKKLVDGVAAVVNDEVVLTSELMDKARPALARLESQGAMRDRETYRILNEALSAMISDKLIRQQLRELRLDVSDAEVDAAIEDVKRQKGIDDETLKTAIESEGLSYKEYKEALRTHLLRSKLFAIRVRPRVKITDEDVKNWYTQNVNAASADAGVKLAAIFVPVPRDPKPSDVQEARKKANQAYARAVAGEDFARLAIEYSEDPSGKTGGDMGVVKKGTLNPDLDRAVFSLKEGQISEPVETPGAFYIFKAIKVLAGEPKALKDVKEDIFRRLFEEESERQFKLWLEEVKRDAHIEIKIKEGGSGQ
jgi:peptidyl-prolyl cis-trans isomerase SurA